MALKTKVVIGTAFQANKKNLFKKHLAGNIRQFL